jgi:hypothetical protein
MQVAGVQAAGSKGLSGVTVAVNDPQSNKPGFAAPSSKGEVGSRSPQALTPEPVVFPREGLPVDQRPAQLRLLKASNRYRESQELHEHGSGVSRRHKRSHR